MTTKKAEATATATATATIPQRSGGDNQKARGMQPMTGDGCMPRFSV
jgi:hypothetical protein